MIDFERITGFDWDEGNRRKNFDSHGVADFEAEEIFLDPRVTMRQTQNIANRNAAGPHTARRLKVEP